MVLGYSKGMADVSMPQNTEKKLTQSLCSKNIVTFKVNN